jgi:hypothetical protein
MVARELSRRCFIPPADRHPDLSAPGRAARLLPRRLARDLRRHRARSVKDLRRAQDRPPFHGPHLCRHLRRAGQQPAGLAVVCLCHQAGGSPGPALAGPFAVAPPASPRCHHGAAAAGLPGLLAAARSPLPPKFHAQLHPHGFSIALSVRALQAKSAAPACFGSPLLPAQASLAT